MLRKLVDKVTGRTAAWLFGGGIAFLIQSELDKMPPDDRCELTLELMPQLLDMVAELLPWRKRMPRCKDCGEYGHGFMLRDDVWEAVLTATERIEYPVGEPTEITKAPLYICLQCCSHRLNRPIVVGDLMENVQINRPLLYAFGMGVTSGPPLSATSQRRDRGELQEH